MFAGFSTDKSGRVTELGTPDLTNQTSVMTRASGNFAYALIWNHRTDPGDQLYVNADSTAVDLGTPVPEDTIMFVPVQGTDLNFASPDGLWDFTYTLYYNP
jgi:hypothetical protein